MGMMQLQPVSHGGQKLHTWATALLGSLLVLVFGACKGSDDAGLLQLEVLSFIPRAGHSLAAEPNMHADDWGLERAILMGRFEVTRAEFLQHLRRTGAAPLLASVSWKAHEYHWEDQDLSLPAEMTFGEAEDFAAAHGLRLPTAREWLHVALGRSGQWYPWGTRDQSSVCNTLDAGLGRPTPVGTFASGRSPLFDCYDLLGNLWEWTSSYVPGRMDSDFMRWWMVAGGGDGSDGSSGLVSVMGGSYSSPRYELYTWVTENTVLFNSRTVDRDSVTPEIGARMCADAADYLWEHAAHWGSGSEAEERVRSVGKRWSRDRFAREQLSVLLAELNARAEAPEALAWLEQGVQEVTHGG